MNEPKLRFKADDGSTFPDWEEKKLEDVVEFLDGQRKPLEAGKRVAGEYPYYGASGIIDYVDNYIFDEELILLSEDGANILDRNYRVCFLARGKYWVNNHAHVLRAMSGNVNGFLCEQLESFDYRKYNSGSAQPKLNQETCRSIIVNVPSLPEQQKIADFLSTIDTVIEKQKATVEAWEERKKGVMQKLFSQEVRFKADDGSDFPEWEEKKLNEIAVRVTRKNKDNVTDIPLTISSADGLIDQRNFFNKVVASKDMSGYFLLKNGEFAYNKSYSKDYDFGSIKRLDLYDEGALSTLYICFALNKNENSDFYQKYFDSLSWYPELQKICAEGARNHGLLNVPTNDFFQLKLCVPSSDKEQQKIADCLSSLDEVIEKQKATLAAWEELKKGLLQQMFV